MNASSSSSPPRRTLLLTLAAVAVVVVALFVLALVFGGNDDDEAGVATSSASTVTTAQGLEVAQVGIEGAPLPAFPEDANGLADPARDPAVGQVAPSLDGVSFDGSPVTVTSDGTAKLVLFVAHWCPHCQREVPKVQQLVDDGAVPSNVRVVAVSTAVRPADGNYPPSAWLTKEGWTSPVLLDDQSSSAAQAYSLPAFPYGVYVDGQNRVVARTAGEIDTDTIEGLLRQLSRP
jgi:cytochrome c biogenesis protein CcmG/thiol:disulfide interchange protein DsbE